MNIIIVDDDAFVSMSLKTILEATGEITVLACGKSGSDAITLYRQYRPDVLLMDIRMEDMNGLDAASLIIKEFSEARILLLTTFSDDEYIIKAIKIGAKGYILKQAFDTIAPALNAVFNGQTVFEDQIIGKLPSLLTSPTKSENLADKWGVTQKELEIIKLVADGLNNKEIASTLFLSEGTIRNYISNILEKLSLRDRTGLACFYYKNI